jgi:hypothetical protein
MKRDVTIKWHPDFLLFVRFFVALFIHIGIDFIGKLNIVALLIALTITLIITS